MYIATRPAPDAMPHPGSVTDDNRRLVPNVGAPLTCTVESLFFDDTTSWGGAARPAPPPGLRRRTDTQTHRVTEAAAATSGQVLLAESKVLL